MALALPAHGQRGVHVDVVAGKVQRDQPLEHHAVGGLGGCEEDEQARRRAAVGDHIEHGAEARTLVELARRPAVQRVEQARDGVQKAAATGVQRHEVQRSDAQHHASITCATVSTLLPWSEEDVSWGPRTNQIWHEEEDVLVRLLRPRETLRIPARASIHRVPVRLAIAARWRHLGSAVADCSLYDMLSRPSLRQPGSRSANLWAIRTGIQKGPAQRDATSRMGQGDPANAILLLRIATTLKSIANAPPVSGWGGGSDGGWKDVWVWNEWNWRGADAHYSGS